MKKSIITLVLAAGILSLTACDKDQKQSNANNSNTNSETNNNNMSKIVFVDVEEMQNKLDFFNNKKDEFAKLEKNIANELNQLQKNIQNAAVALNNRIQNKDISEVDLQKGQRNIESMQINYQKKAESLQANMINKQTEFNITLKNMLDQFSAEYNKEKNYDVIMSAMSALYKKKELDITEDFAKSFNEWVNKRLTDEAIMKAFAKENKNNNSTSIIDSAK